MQQNNKLHIEFACQMIKAVENLHKVGFIHWDIKSENFVVSDDMKSITLIDFGLCHSVEQVLKSQNESSDIIVSRNTVTNQIFHQSFLHPKCS